MGVNATACRSQEKERGSTHKTGASTARKLLLVNIENSQVLTSR